MQRPWTVPSGSFSARGSSSTASQQPQGGYGATGFGGTGNTAVDNSIVLIDPAGNPNDLDELHRKYRIMELTRKAQTEGSANTLRMQRQQLLKLKKDTDRLKEDLALETRQARTNTAMSATAQILKLQDQGDFYTRKIEAEKRRLEELEKQIKKMQQSILVQRKEMGGINALKENNQGVQKQIRILENRLDKALVKFNEALAHNKSLRENIDNLRRERVVFDGIYNKLARELQRKKSEMNSLMDETNAAYSIRNTAQAEMNHLKEVADREQQHFEEEWKKLGGIIEKDRKMKDFINRQAVSRSSRPGVDPAVEEEAALRKRVTQGAWSIATDKASIHLSMEKVQAYEEAFAKIQKATRITDMDALVDTFVKAEDQNFSLFNYVNDLANEIEKVEEKIEQVNGEIEKYRGKGEAADLARKKTMAELDEKLKKNVDKTQSAQAKFSESSKTLNALKSGIGHIFQRLGCGNNSKASEILGNAGVTESNMMQYLGLIEQRTNELLQLYHAHREELGPLIGGAGESEYESTNRQAFARTQPRAGGGGGGGMEEPSIHAPSAAAVSDEEGEEDDDVQPLTREEIQRQAQHSGEDY
jgi:chromosome segregation ATPase